MLSTRDPLQAVKIKLKMRKKVTLKRFFKIWKLKGSKYYNDEITFKVGFQICVLFQKRNGELDERALQSEKRA